MGSLPHRLRNNQRLILCAPSPDHLDAVWSEMEVEMSLCNDVYGQAIIAFLRMARAQFFWDVNKRTGRFMMNGILLNAGYPIINVPAKRQQEFNQLMLKYYNSGEITLMSRFLRECVNPKIIENFRR